MLEFSAAQLFGRKLGSDGSSGSFSTPPLHLTTAKYTFPFTVNVPENRIEARFIHFLIPGNHLGTTQLPKHAPSTGRSWRWAHSSGPSKPSVLLAEHEVRHQLGGVVGEQNMTVDLFQNHPATRNSNGPGNVSGKSEE